MLMLLADGAQAFDPTPLIASAGSLGFAIWFGVYVMMYFLPAQQTEHRAQLKEQAERFAQTVKEQAEYSASTIKEIVLEMRAERESYDRWRMGTH